MNNSSNGKLFYPVIPCLDPQKQYSIGHALTNTKIAMENGADGVFLVGRNLHPFDTFYIYEHVRKQFPDVWIGVGFLNLPLKSNRDAIMTVASECSKLNALWIDVIPDERLELPPTIQVFGGITLKGFMSDVSDKVLARVCKKAIKYVDVVTISEDSSHSIPECGKLRTIKKILDGKAPLALVDGISVNNTSSFLQYVEAVLVAISLYEKSPGPSHDEHLVPERVSELANLIHG